jgi:hypothetical protein
LFNFDKSVGSGGLTFGMAAKLGAEAHLSVFNRRRSDMFASAEGFLRGVAFSNDFTVASFITAVTAGGTSKAPHLGITSESAWGVTCQYLSFHAYKVQYYRDACSG